MKKTALKRCVDLLMAAALLALMSYSLIGEAAHEWIGLGMFLLLAAHLRLNRKWLQSLGRGRYPAYRAVQTVLAAACLLAMLGLLSSGVLLSRHVFFALRLRGRMRGLARRAHMACAFWGFALTGLHLGLHWGWVLNAAGRFPVTRTRGFRLAGWLIAAYGAFAFWKRGFPDYLLLRTHFLFLDGEEPILLFFLDHLAILGLFVLCAHYGARLFSRKTSNM